MKHITEIVQRLLKEGHITAEEAVIILKAEAEKSPAIYPVQRSHIPYASYVSPIPSVPPSPSRPAMSSSPTASDANPIWYSVSTNMPLPITYVAGSKSEDCE